MQIFFNILEAINNKLSLGPTLFSQNYPEDPLGITWVGCFWFKRNAFEINFCT